MSEHIICEKNELADGDRIVLQLEGREIAVFRVQNEFYAVTNWCIHQGGPVCDGMLTGLKKANFDKKSSETTVRWEREGEILRCPWHAWEFDITTGNCIVDDGKLITHPVRITEDDEVVVEL